MRFHTHQVFGALLGVCVWVAVARSVLDSKRFTPEERELSANSDDEYADIEARNASLLFARDTDGPMADDTPPGFGCRSMCGIATPSTSSKRQLEDRSWLQKRVFEPFPPTPNTQKARDQYMITHVDALQTGQEIVPYVDNADDYATAVTGALGTTTVTFGMRGICGCTWLAVISQKRVYLGHYWESLSFGKPEGATYRLQFATQVTNFLTSGYKGQPSLASVAADFKGDPGLQAYIYTPESEAKPGTQEYPDKIAKMVSAINGLVGVAPTVRTYDAQDAKTPSGQTTLENTGAGHMLFDYDPTGGSRAKPNAWRMLWESQVVAVGQWKA
ncbi:hypothetical protein HO173_004715 [Letharia columbiana]|uniref:Uncharacterized protein n=1 Tax=Letharia columbiana TaxID=112416 RepID=A0A8H6FYM6_9LECA|nr:uncharacterized protein HO173_004715 [Letharia columbiana]KAF6237247.1 hypothetical protein HO173_004715 [Letharia columbiana]